MKLRTWAKSKGLSEKDIGLLNQISYGLTKGKRGRAKELKEMLESDGFKLHTK
ncbi:hypothetical protein [Helicobacter typhlonius]|uniref:hypothetical protein n=1 Tax=Helicobacter typhlonius TaxID=76936 RepID=UPI002FE155A4